MKKETTIFLAFTRHAKSIKTLAVAHGAKQSKHYRKKRRTEKTKKEKINEQKCTLNCLAPTHMDFHFLSNGARKSDRAKKLIAGKLSIRYFEYIWPIKARANTRNAKRIEISFVVPGNCFNWIVYWIMGEGSGLGSVLVAMLNGLAHLFPTSLSAKLSQPILPPCIDLVHHISCSILLFQCHVKQNRLTKVFFYFLQHTSSRLFVSPLMSSDLWIILGIPFRIFWPFVVCPFYRCLSVCLVN